MSEEKAMNIYQKLQKCRAELSKSKIKKSGKNDYSHYDYFELGDFLPMIIELEDKYKLASIFAFSKEEAGLSVIDTEDLEKKIEFKTPVSISPLKGCNEMQNIGAAQSYARRYLYFMAFEVSEPDILDSGVPVDEVKLHEIKKIDPIRISTIKEMLKKTHSNEKSFLQYFKVKRVEDITNGLFPKVMDTLQKKEDEMQKNQAKLEKAKQKKEMQGTIPDLGI